MNKTLQLHTYPTGETLELVHGDLTAERVDAIVNAANARLQHGGGVAALIARIGGPAIDRESRAWVREHGPVTHDQPAWTTGGNLPARFVIHVVGPVWGSGEDDAKLAAAVSGSLRVAAKLGLESIALPAISTGIFGFPRRRAAGVIFNTITGYFAQSGQSGPARVRLTLFDEPSVQDFTEVFRATFKD